MRELEQVFADITDAQIDEMISRKKAVIHAREAEKVEATRKATMLKIKKDKE